MKTAIIDWSNIHENGNLWFNHLKLRKRVFVDDAGWDVPHTDLVEWDQYDTPLTKYVITHQNGEVLAASRLMPCSYAGPNFSYMIRDATLGRLPDIPAGILSEVSRSSSAYEATRFTSNPDLPRREKLAAMSDNAVALMRYCETIGASEVFALMPRSFVPWLRRIGLSAERFGPVTQNTQGESFCVIRCTAPLITAKAPTRAKVA